MAARPVTRPKQEGALPGATIILDHSIIRRVSFRRATFTASGAFPNLLLSRVSPPGRLDSWSCSRVLPANCGEGEQTEFAACADFISHEFGLAEIARIDRPSPGSLRRADASHHVIGREVAGGFLADFDLQGRVPDAEALPQLGRRRQQELVSGMAAGEDEMRGQGVFRRAQGPDMQIMHGANAGAG